MRIEHVGLWTLDLEGLRFFYEKYFHCKTGPKYSNPAKNFESYFLEFDGGARLEIMKKSEVQKQEIDPAGQYVGIAHLAISLGSKEAVVSLTEQLWSDGYRVISGPRTTGDGYFESVIMDPDGNAIEITL